jgi:TRAP-type C4-dicarboxylate transport system permease small subunit
MKTWISYVAKALIAAGTAGVGVLVTALGDGHVTPLEGAEIAAAALLALGAVYGVQNGPKPPAEG